MSLTVLKQQHKLKTQSSQAQKYFEAVPISEAWSILKITGEIKRLYGINAEMNQVQGSMRQLVEVGLVKEYTDGYMRVPVRDTNRDAEEAQRLRESRRVIRPAPLLAPATSKQPTQEPKEKPQVSEVSNEKSTPPSPAIDGGARSLLSNMSSILHAASEQLKTIAEDVDVVLELMEEEHHTLATKMAAMERQVQAAKHLQQALAGFAASSTGA